MNIFDAIAKRHSYRGPYKPDPVPQEDLRQIVQAGLDAPSGRNSQTTRFVIVDDPALTEQIRSMRGANAGQAAAPAFILCITDADPECKPDKMTFHVEDCAAATENMMLALTALGYASVWIDGWLRGSGRAEAIGEMVGLPKSKVVRILMPVGVPAEEGPHREKMPFEQRAWFNSYAV